MFLYKNYDIIYIKLRKELIILYTAKEARSLSEQNLKLRKEEILNIILQNTDVITSINTAIKDAISLGKNYIYFRIEDEKLEAIKEEYFDNYIDLNIDSIKRYGIGAYYTKLGYKVQVTEGVLTYSTLQITW